MRAIDLESYLYQIADEIADEFDRGAVVMSYIMTIAHNYNNPELLDALQVIIEQVIEEQKDLVYKIMEGKFADLLEKYSEDFQE